MTEYRASVDHLGPISHLGPFAFQRALFIDSTGESTLAWGCSTKRRGRASRKARSRAHALLYWWTARLWPVRAELRLARAWAGFFVITRSRRGPSNRVTKEDEQDG